MKIAVWDTYVEREDDYIMHFDIFSFQILLLMNKPYLTMAKLI